MGIGWHPERMQCRLRLVGLVFSFLVVGKYGSDCIGNLFGLAVRVEAIDFLESIKHHFQFCLEIVDLVLLIHHQA